MSRSMAKEKPADMQEGLRGLKCHRGEPGGRGPVGALSDLCPPKEEVGKEGANRAALGLCVEGRRDCGMFAKGECPQGRQG